MSDYVFKRKERVKPVEEVKIESPVIKSPVTKPINTNTTFLPMSNKLSIQTANIFNIKNFTNSLKFYGINIIKWHNGGSFYGSKNGTSNDFLILKGHRKKSYLDFEFMSIEYSLIIPKFIDPVNLECRLKNTNHLGKITMETQHYYGVYWYGTLEGVEHAEKLKNEGLPCQWQKKDEVNIIIP